MPEERITVEEALISSTKLPAYSIHEENEKGTLSKGKLADLVIMNQNILKINPLKIKDTKVTMTIIGG